MRPAHPVCGGYPVGASDNIKAHIGLRTVGGTFQIEAILKHSKDLNFVSLQGGKLKDRGKIGINVWYIDCRSFCIRRCLVPAPRR